MTTPSETLQARRAELTAARLRARRFANPCDRALSTLVAELRVRIAEARVHGLDDVAARINRALCIWMSRGLSRSYVKSERVAGA